MGFKDFMAESYYIERTVGDRIRWWDGKNWSMDNAKGYSSEKLALNVARKIVSQVKAFSDELKIKTST